MEQLEVETSVAAFPNPGKDKIFFHMNNLPEGSYELNIIDNNGKLLQSIIISQPASGELIHEVDLRNYTSGIFAFTLTGAQGTSLSGKFSVIK
ncbi:MAG: T9SS type A sorting domain-containing protein [Bacteroidota bacterium]|nr:T9SS type A sorting domain-containing protein [Bacteroidota bacterium]